MGCPHLINFQFQMGGFDQFHLVSYASAGSLFQFQLYFHFG
jgi:hypothetical protein